MENHSVTVNLLYVKSCPAAIVLDEVNIVDCEETNANAGIRVRPNYAPLEMNRNWDQSQVNKRNHTQNTIPSDAYGGVNKHRD